MPTKVQAKKLETGSANTAKKRKAKGEAGDTEEQVPKKRVSGDC
jgi:hypothetical protein